ncbi:MAG: hypothetical protein M3O07_07195 [Pseudomonadota bacterium]|nr:hypothetical protein [Pseudomonadota bacterium]
MRRTTAAATALAAFAGGANQPAAAHAFGQRYDLPLPLDFFLAGGAAVVLLSFIIAVAMLRPASDRAWQWVLPPLPRWLRAAAGSTLTAVGVFLFMLVLIAGCFGKQDSSENIAPVLVWVLWWVGLLLVTALIGNVWPCLDPWSTIWRQARSWLGRPPPVPTAGSPPWGAWPAVAMYFIFAWLELASDFGELPRDLALLVLLYSVGAWTGMALFGENRWRAGADLFSRVFGLFGRFAPFSRNPVGQLTLQLPGAGLLGEHPRALGEIAFVLVVLATVTFDGLSETPPWTSAVIWLAHNPSLRPALLWLGDWDIDILMTAKTLGLLLTALVFFAVFAIVCKLSALAGGGVSGRQAMRTFALSFLPIAIAYHAAHYLSYLLLAGQLAISVASDPFGWGWDLFGTRGRAIDLGVISMKSVWYIAVVSIVIGHVISVTLAHIEALRLFPTRRAATLSQLPMLVLMLAFTSTSLWILSQPIVQEPG